LGDSSPLPSALDAEARALVEEAIARVGSDRDELPPNVVERIEQRARVPDQRLVVGRYLLTGELGRGGMGVVYEAWDPGIERRVAIKTIEPDLVPEEERDEVVERFRRETKVVGRLHHPSIVTIFDSGNERGLDEATGNRIPILYYYVMEYLEGMSLARVLREQHLLPEVEALRIARDIAEALDLSHQAGIIHRDIKPSNIFLRENLQAVLLDFGIAKTGSVNITRQGQILGTPSYLAPERLREKEAPIDGRADIFSLGVLLFTMLTGEAPFVGEDVYEVIDKIAKENHPRLERGTPAGRLCSEVIDRMLAKNPDDRYGSAGEAAFALDGVLRLLSGERPTSIIGEFALPEISGDEVLSLDEPTPHEDEDDTGRLEHPPEPSGPSKLGSALPSEQITSPKQPISSPAAIRPTASLDDDEEEEAPLKKTMISSPPPEAVEAEQSFAQDEQTSEDLPAQMRIPDQGPTDLLPKAKSDPFVEVRVAEVLSTRPELALQRETRELHNKRSAAVLDDEPPPEPTSPSIPKFRAIRPGQYADHAVENDESTDDETLADPSGGSGHPVLPPHSPHPGDRAVARAFHDERATEQLSRAERPAGSRPPIARARRSRIEASLVDEEDVVVKPAPLDALKPDEIPTQAGARRPLEAPPAEVLAAAQVSNPEVVRARGDSRVKDPAELTQGGAMIPEKDEDERKSAAVARKTIGPARARSLSSSAGIPGNIQVRVTGRAFGFGQEDRMRMLRRRGVMLLAGALASVGIGLMLGRMQRSGAATDDVMSGSELPSPQVEPRASVRKIPGTDQIELARPRPPAELIADAEAAQTAGQLEDASRLFSKAIESTEEGAPLRARARLGLADVMRARGDAKEAVAQYLMIVRQYGGSEEAQQAKVALVELGVSPDPPRRPRASPQPQPQPQPPPPAEAATPPPPVLFKPDDALTPKEQCNVLLKRYLQSPAEAVEAFEDMRRKHPNEPCVYWNLGRKYEQLERFRQALTMYRRYIELDPQASQRDTIEKKKIPNLEAKLRQ
jgi:serine/threonine protein kinase